ncbi:hypothetical protein GCM10009085_26430 [Pseudomonas avellanae]|nr:hypothetical protein GCM10009085_26430 [Pseudomonas avellanae]
MLQRNAMPSPNLTDSQNQHAARSATKVKHLAQSFIGNAIRNGRYVSHLLQRNVMPGP